MNDNPRKRSKIQVRKLILLCIIIVICVIANFALTIRLRVTVATEEPLIFQARSRTGKSNPRRIIGDTKVAQSQLQNQRELSIVLDSLIDYSNETSNNVKKGFKKCLYYDKYNRSVGYLIAVDINNVSDYGNYQKGYNLAVYNLSKDYPTIPNFHLERPYILPSITQQQAAKLNSKLQKPRFFPGTLVHVHKVLLAPNPHIIIGCIRPKYKYPASIDKFRQFILHHVIEINSNINITTHGHVDGNDKYGGIEVDNASTAILLPEAINRLEIFYGNLRANFELVKNMIKSYKCLIYDFQVVVDTQGNLYQIGKLVVRWLILMSKRRLFSTLLHV